MKKIAKLYLHSDKDSNYDLGAQLKLSEEAMNNFRFALSEVAFDIEVDTKTGKYKILKVDGRELK